MSIKVENLTHIYMPKSPFEKIALDNVSLDINDGEFIALIRKINFNSTFQWPFRSNEWKNNSRWN